MSNSKPFEEKSPFLQNEMFFAESEAETSFDERLETPFLAAELQVQSEEETPYSTEEYVEPESPDRPCRCKDEEVVDTEDEEGLTETWDTETDVLDEPEEEDLTSDEASEQWLPEGEGEGEAGPDSDGGKRRVIILAVGIEYPKYNDSPVEIHGKPGKWWTLANKKPNAGEWHKEARNIARMRFAKHPNLTIFFYDFFLARLELGKLVRGKIVWQITSQFSPLVHGDYRWVDGDPQVLKQIDLNPLPAARYKARPIIRYCPSVSTMPGEPTQADWLRKFGSSRWDAHGLSVRHIYEHIQAIGAKDPYTLKEFHSFGHASSGLYPVKNGTVFVNTTHFGADTAPRHPLDLDPRAVIDFRQPMDVRKFRMAFAKGAMSYVWGCDWDHPLLWMLQAIILKLGNKSLTDNMKFKFVWNGKEVQFRQMTTSCTGATWNAGPPPTVEMDGKCVRSMLTMLMNNTYMQHLANASAHCVTGGLPATYSDHDTKSENGSLHLSHIPMHRPRERITLYCNPTANDKCDQSFLSVLRFYAKQLGVVFNREGAHREFGRGYALFCPDISPHSP